MKFILIAILVISSSIQANPSSNSLVNKYKIAYEKKTYFPSINSENHFYSINQSYKQQNEWVKYLLKENKKYGFKSSLSTKKDQLKYNINNPIFGVIIAKTPYTNFDIFYKSDFINLHVSAKLGIKLKRKITKQIKNSYDLKKEIHSIYPIIELSEYKFKDLKKITINDLIISNTGTSGFIQADKIKIKDLDKIKVNIKQNKSTEFTTINYSTDQLLNQLKWTINRALSNGWKIHSKELIFTSAYTELIPAKKGKYIIDFTNYSSIVFEIR
jgi:2-keto-4-pentenoate hydratase